jgi:inhibitor of KinA
METAEGYLKQASFHPVGETALMVSFGDVISPDILRCTSALMKELKVHPVPGMIECTVSYTGVTVFYNPSEAVKDSTIKGSTENKGYFTVLNHLKALLKNIALTNNSDSPIVKIPVCFGGEYGPDLNDLATQHHLTPEEVIHIFTGAEYLVYMIGFAPGYPYMGGLPEILATPRRSSPRLVIPKGSVAIGGAQAGIYPMESPGGFNLIGRTPLELFRPENKEDPTVLHSGDHIKFYAVSNKEYQEILQKEGTQPCK